MSPWKPADLAILAEPDEMEIATRRRDGSVRGPVTIWMVRHGGELYVRSVGGPEAGWYSGAQNRHRAEIAAGGLTRDVELIEADHGLDDQSDAEYRRKHARYSEDTLRWITSPEARATTLRLAPHQHDQTKETD
ncbi:MAG: DUF2255 family protein [Solirubrobacteraceae bacterium]|jgi:hypothetical protein